MATINFTNSSTALPSNNVTRTELLNWAYGLQFATGTMAKALDELASTGLIELTNAGAGTKAAAIVPVTATGKAVVNVASYNALRQAITDSETVSTATSLDLTKLVTLLSATAGANLPITIGAGSYVGQQKIIMLLAASARDFELTGTFLGFTSITFGDYGGGVGYSALLEWDGAAWTWIGGNAAVIP